MLLLQGMNTLRPILLALTAVAALSVAHPATANFIATIDQVGTNVVVTGSGSINFTDLSFFSFSGFNSFIGPSSGEINVGAVGGATIYSGISGPGSFGSGGGTFPDSTIGDDVALNGPAGLLAVPFGYVSGAALSDSMTFNNATFASLGLTPGTYEWTWGAGANQNFTLEIGTVPDGGSTFLCSVGFGGFCFGAGCAAKVW